MSVASPKKVLRRSGPQAKAVGSFVAKLTGKAFEKYGFSTVMLLTDWRTIVGEDLAGYTLPERLKWPRNVDTYGETPVDQRGRPGATLVLRVDSARSLDVQYQSAQIIDRINAYFGYQAVTEIRFVQAPVEPARVDAPGSMRPARATGTGKSTSAPAHEAGAANGLEAALSRLEVSVVNATKRPQSDKIAVN